MPAADVLDFQAREKLLEVLASVVRADGRVADEERAAFRGVAAALGLPGRTLDEQGELDAASLAGLSPRDAMLVYCAASWIALADAIQVRAESRALEALRRSLRIEPETARMLAGHARWVRVSTRAPWHREADLLLAEGARRLALLEARSNAA